MLQMRYRILYSPQLTKKVKCVNILSTVHSPYISQGVFAILCQRLKKCEHMSSKSNLKCKSGELISGHSNPDLVFDRPKDKLNPKTKIRKIPCVTNYFFLLPLNREFPNKDCDERKR